MEPYQGEYEILETAATDPYTRCGFTKVINISRLEDFLLPHLPNKYVGLLGADYGTFLAQIEALKEIAAHKRPAICALPEVHPPLSQPWVKSYYEPYSRELVSWVPKGARSILSLGMGAGATECELVRRGFEVTALPLDSVICADAESKGVSTVYSELAQGPEALRGRQFDCLLIRNLLYLQKDPASVLSSFSPLLAANGRLLIMEPNFGNVQTRVGRLLRKRRYRVLARSRVSAVTVPRLRRWLVAAGLVVKRVVHIGEEAVSPKDQVLRALPSGLASTAVVLVAERCS